VPDIQCHRFVGLHGAPLSTASRLLAASTYIHVIEARLSLRRSLPLAAARTMIAAIAAATLHGFRAPAAALDPLQWPPNAWDPSLAAYDRFNP